jgi:hypothetical protein
MDSGSSSWNILSRRLFRQSDVTKPAENKDIHGNKKMDASPADLWIRNDFDPDSMGFVVTNLESGSKGKKKKKNIILFVIFCKF